jgi:molecular chaperone GrpE
MNKHPHSKGSQEPSKQQATRQAAEAQADKGHPTDREAAKQAGQSARHANEQNNSQQAAQETAAEETRESVSVKELQEEIERKNEEIIRLNAEMDNIRKRNAREMENLRKYALDKFTKELLPVVDSLEKAMQVDRENTSVDQVLEGTELTQKILNKVLQNHGLEVIDPHGEKFNPDFHDAVSAVPSEDVEPNTVLDVFQKGYSLNGRVVRPAMVVVSK